MQNFKNTECSLNKDCIIFFLLIIKYFLFLIEYDSFYDDNMQNFKNTECSLNKNCLIIKTSEIKGSF
jgi:hypothetical protein